EWRLGGSGSSQGRASWKPLVGGRLKCNVDFAWFEQEGLQGKQLLEALSWLKSLLDNVIESDCLLIVSALSHPLSDISK
ncbi:hypothetical protein Gotri_006226, partial [Gossypium trilobum]|nr:hypothetical protein [Gossypium trilobum]